MLRYFGIQELVSPAAYEARGERAWELLDPRVVVLDELREAFGPIVVNDWAWGGGFTQSGFREPESRVGADFSQHRFGRAFDLKPRDIVASELHRRILADADRWRAVGITGLEAMEATPTWVHVDLRWPRESGIWVFQP